MRRIRAGIGVLVTMIAANATGIALSLVMRLDGRGVPVLSKVIAAAVIVNVILGAWLGLAIAGSLPGIRHRFWRWAASTVVLLATIAWSMRGTVDVSRGAAIACSIAIVALIITGVDIHALPPGGNGVAIINPRLRR